MRVVIKIGTSSLTKEDGNINLNIIRKLVLVISKLVLQNNDVILVTSGAVGCGKSLIKKGLYIKDENFIKKDKYTVIDKTILSGAGQAKLISYYADEFLKIGFIVQQILLAGEKDIKGSHFINNINGCFKLGGIVPIINANDTVYNKELMEDVNERFSDNDILAAEVAKYISADKLILITNVNGYLNELGEVIEEISYDEIDSYISNTENTVSNGGTGGMKSKLMTAKISCCDTIIIHNSQILNIDKILDGEKIGTKIKRMHS